NQERTLEDTHTRFVAIISIVVVAYRARAGGAVPADLQKFIKRQEVKFVDNLNYKNNCLFDALSFISLPDEQTKRKSNTSRVAEGKRLMKQFYSAIGNEQIKNIEAFCSNYQGFDLASEDKQLANIFNINICVYAYNNLDFEEEPTQEVETAQARRHEVETQPKLNSKDNLLGFNSAHFDMIFVLPYLTSSKWHITNYLGDFSRIKRVEVRHKITGVRILFLDAEMFVTKMKLKNFVKDFSPSEFIIDNNSIKKK
ncbi:MAG: hypothetical protein EZS28_042191, partial [Streblomastix strix]